jgi:hypothetical protein
MEKRMSENMVERVSQAIESIELFSRYNDFTSDAVEGLPIEVCRYCNWGEGQDGENIEVVARFPSGWDVAKELPKMVIERQARAAIEAMRTMPPGMLSYLQMNTEIGAHVCANWAGAYSCMEEYHSKMIDAALKD